MTDETNDTTEPSDMAETAEPQEQVIRLTLLVVVISFVVSAYIFAFDNVFHLVIDKGVLNIPDATPAPPTQ